MKEETFGQEMAGIEFEDDFQVRGIPLPSQVPGPLDLRQFPDSIKKSGAIEALIAQNDDLMSRLSVSLRRIAELEDKLLARDTETTSLRAKYENLKDQVLVLREKSKILSDRKSMEEADVNGLKEQIRVLEIRYSELYQVSQTKESRLLDQLSQQTRQAGRLTRYRDRIRRAVRSAHENSKFLTQENTRLSARVGDQETQLEGLRKNILESAEYIKTQSRENETRLQSLTENYEKQTQALTVRLEELEAKRALFEATMDKAADLENEVVLRERRLQEFRMQTSTEISDLQKALARYRNESNELATQLAGTKTELAEATATLGEFRQENFKLTEQVENLQTLWRDQQSQLEKTNAKSVSLQKLNQELSVTVNQYRRDIRDLRERLEEASRQGADAQALAVTKAKMQDAHTDSSTQATQSPDLMEKIDRVLANMQISKE